MNNEYAAFLKQEEAEEQGICEDTNAYVDECASNLSVPVEDVGLDLEDTAMSYDEWKAQKLYVRKGERSGSRDALGTPQFLLSQVVAYDSSSQNIIIEGIMGLNEESKQRFIDHTNKMRARAAKPSFNVNSQVFGISGGSFGRTPYYNNKGKTKGEYSSIDKSLSSMNAAHEQLRKVEDHLDSVGFKHHPNIFYDDVTDSWGDLDGYGE